MFLILSRQLIDVKRVRFVDRMRSVVLHQTELGIQNAAINKIKHAL